MQRMFDVRSSVSNGQLRASRAPMRQTAAMCQSDPEPPVILADPSETWWPKLATAICDLHNDKSYALLWHRGVKPCRRGLFERVPSGPLNSPRFPKSDFKNL
jgi:hypothetical protein